MEAKNQMDPLTVTGAFAQIVGLIADFVAHRSDQRSAELPEFLEWLQTHGHDELLTAIKASHSTATSIQMALAEGNQQVLARLNAIEKSLAALCDPQGPFCKLAESLRPGAFLSDQAKAILVEFERSGAVEAIEVRDRGSVVALRCGAKDNIAIEERRSYRDDIERLLEIGFLRVTPDAKGNRAYSLSREGIGFAQRLLHDTQRLREKGAAEDVQDT
jgi:hypothetical protein